MGRHSVRELGLAVMLVEQVDLYLLADGVPHPLDYEDALRLARALEDAACKAKVHRDIQAEEELRVRIAEQQPPVGGSSDPDQGP